MAKLAGDWILYTASERDSESAVVQEHAQLVKGIAKHLLGRLPSCVQLEDLIQAGMIGLLEASKNYDVSKGASFKTYASIRARGSMLDEIRKGDWAPRSVHRNTRKMAESVRKLENQIGRDPRDTEIAKELNMNLEAYHRLLQETHSSRIFAMEDVGLQEDMLAEGMTISAPSPLEGLQKEDFKQSLAKGIESLPERERLVLALYYDEELNLKEVGKILGVSESRVSQIHSQAMGRLQNCLKVWNTKEDLL